MYATCAFCGLSMEFGHAIDTGWLPSYWSGEVEHSDPVCPDCAAEHLREAEDGEYEWTQASVRRQTAAELQRAAWDAQERCDAR